jgi:hypothetical protein
MRRILAATMPLLTLFTYLSYVAPRVLHAQTAAEPEPVPVPATPGVTDAEQRIAPQRAGQAFARTTLGLDFSTSPTGPALPLPAAGGTFSNAPRAPLAQLALQIGGLHFFDHADIFINVPVYALPGEHTSEGESRRVFVRNSAATGLKYYPFALRSGTLRPFVTSAVQLRRFSIEETTETGRNTGVDKRFVLPLGIGLGYRLDPLLIGVQVEYTFFDVAEVRSGQAVRPLDESETLRDARQVDLRGLRYSFGVKALFDVSSELTERQFHRLETQRMAERVRNGTANAFNIGLGPSTRLLGANSPYFERRPYLKHAHDDRIFPHLALGMYQHAWDAEVRLAYRSIWGAAQAFGAELETSQHAVFLEALKFVEVGLYGFVPFVGVGVGYGQLNVTDRAAGQQFTASNSTGLLSVPFGWDIRPKPSSWWLLRTSLRWIPKANLSMAAGIRYDFGGLEFDVIQFLFYPERLLW